MVWRHAGSGVIFDQHGWLVADVNLYNPNAKPALIAAAPDLLAACEAYAAWAGSVTEGAPDLRPIRDQIRAAIAMAKGE